MWHSTRWLVLAQILCRNCIPHRYIRQRVSLHNTRPVSKCMRDVPGARQPGSIARTHVAASEHASMFGRNPSGLPSQWSDPTMKGHVLNHSGDAIPAFPGMSPARTRQIPRVVPTNCPPRGSRTRPLCLILVLCNRANPIVNGSTIVTEPGKAISVPAPPYQTQRPSPIKWSPSLTATMTSSTSSASNSSPSGLQRPLSNAGSTCHHLHTALSP